MTPTSLRACVDHLQNTALNRPIFGWLVGCHIELVGCHIESIGCHIEVVGCHQVPGGPDGAGV